MHKLSVRLKQEIGSSLRYAYSSVLDNCIEYTLSIYLLDFHRDKYLSIAVVKLYCVLEHVEKD